MLEHHFRVNFRKWVSHQDVNKVHDVDKIGFEKDFLSACLNHIRRPGEQSNTVYLPSPVFGTIPVLMRSQKNRWLVQSVHPGQST